jgi:hypothetical protein
MMSLPAAVLLLALQAKEVEAVVADLKGSVDVKRKDDQDWVPAEKGMKLAKGAELCTGVSSRCSLEFLGHVKVEVKPLTQATIEELARLDDAGRAAIQLKFGTLQVDVRKGDLRSDLRVTAPNSTTSVSGSKGIVHIPATGGGAGIVILRVLSGSWSHEAGGVVKDLKDWGLADNAGNRERDLRYLAALQDFLDFWGRDLEELYRTRGSRNSGDGNPWEQPFWEWAVRSPASPKHLRASALSLPPPTPPGP